MTQEAPFAGVGRAVRLLGPGDPAPVHVRHLGAKSPFLLVCDHGGRAVPRKLGRLDVAEAVFDTHIAWDIGALGYAERLAESLESTLIHQTYSRLVIDCNRDPDHPQAVPETSDQVVIPGNNGLSDADRAARVAAIHTPYHVVIAAEVSRRLGEGERPLMICAHSFTPKLQQDVRPWHVGVLHGGKSPASETLIRLLRGEGDLIIGDNQPYAMDGTDYTAPVHAWAHGLDVIELEVRQDLIAQAEGQQRFANLFARLLPRLPIGC